MVIGRLRLGLVLAVLIRSSAALDLAAFFALVELALGCLSALDTFETRTSALTGNIHAPAVILWIAVFDASERTGSTDGLDAVALALCRTAREASGARDMPVMHVSLTGGRGVDGAGSVRRIVGMMEVWVLRGMMVVSGGRSK